MKKAIKIILSILTIGLIYIFTYVPKLSKQHGILETKLYLSNGEKQPLIVAFGGGDGGNDWSRNYLKEKRNYLNNKGYALLAIGYFKSKGTPKNLDRISLDAISDTIMNIAKRNKIDTSKIILMGGSKGGELVLNLASRYNHFHSVIALSSSNVSFPAITWTSNTSSWNYKNKEVTYVPAPLKTLLPALKGDLYNAFNIMLADTKAVKKAEINVENIKAAILLISGKKDNQWPATRMSNRIMERLKENNFKFHKEHIILNGGHTAPLKQFHLVYDFLEKHIPINK